MYFKKQKDFANKKATEIAGPGSKICTVVVAPGDRSWRWQDSIFLRS